MSVLIAGMYIHAPQGRVEGLCTVPYKEVLAMVKVVQEEQRSTAALSSTFKTYAKYGYQPVLIPVSMLNVLLVYISVRPRSNPNAYHSQNPPSLATPIRDPNPFFVDFNGKAYSSSVVSRLVVNFFKKHLGLHVTTTGIRSLCEIMTDKALTEGHITGIINFLPNPSPTLVSNNNSYCNYHLATQSKAVHNINGHTSATTADYYLRQSRLQDAQHGVEVYAAINRNSVPLVPNPKQHLLDWGSLHPCKAATRSDRVRWTAFEKSYVVRWCRRAVEENPRIEYKVVTMLLQHIKSKPDLVAQFHPHHTVDANRLAYPWKQFKKEQKAKTNPIKSTTTEKEPMIDPSILATGVVSAY